MDEKMIRKQIRRSFHPVGWSLVVYYIIMNAAVGIVMFVDLMLLMIDSIGRGGDVLQDALTQITNNGWGYILAGIVGLVILFCWKGKKFWKEQIWAKGRLMTPDTFAALLVLVVGCQMVATIGGGIMELILNQFGLSAQEAMRNASPSMDTFSMWLYVAVWAPVTEELLFRGLIQRLMLPYGKRFAIFGSAFLFGIFHGNLIQSPYAFLVGLILGYVACEHSIAWAMLLHMINNMVLGDSFSRITMGLPAGIGNLIFLLLTGGCALAGIVILLAKHRSIQQHLGPKGTDKRVLGCFFTNPGIIALTVIMLLNMFLMIAMF